MGYEHDGLRIGVSLVRRVFDPPLTREPYSYSEPNAIAHPADPRPSSTGGLFASHDGLRIGVSLARRVLYPPATREPYGYSQPNVIANPADPRPGLPQAVCSRRMMGYE